MYSFNGKYISCRIRFMTREPEQTLPSISAKPNAKPVQSQCSSIYQRNRLLSCFIKSRSIFSKEVTSVEVSPTTIRRDESTPRVFECMIHPRSPTL